MNDIYDNRFDAVVLAGGDYPTAQQPLEILHGAEYVVCCDGAADRHISLGHTPDAIVGDGDSISAANRERFASRLHIVSDGWDQMVCLIYGTDTEAAGLRHLMGVEASQEEQNLLTWLQNMLGL